MTRAPMGRWLRRLIRRLSRTAMPAQTSNVDYNRAYWDRYARGWNKHRIEVENPRVSSDQREAYLTHLGDEWGAKSAVEQVVSDYIVPFITKDSVVGEIGVGGGRIASRIAPMTKSFYCFDVSSEMLNHARAALAGQSQVRYGLLTSPHFEWHLAGQFDFLYSFDVFVHLDLHTMWRYLQAIHTALAPGGKVFLHVANLRTPAGWTRFASQDAYRVEGFYFVCPELIDILVSHSGLTMIKRSQGASDNFYVNRDDCFVLEKRR